MKIVATLSDYNDVVHAGGDIDKRSVVIDLGDDDKLPPLLREYLVRQKWAREGQNRYTYQSMSFSILEDPEP